MDEQILWQRVIGWQVLKQSIMSVMQTLEEAIWNPKRKHQYSDKRAEFFSVVKGEAKIFTGVQRGGGQHFFGCAKGQKKLTIGKSNFLGTKFMHWIFAFFALNMVNDKSVYGISGYKLLYPFKVNCHYPRVFSILYWYIMLTILGGPHCP